MIFRQMGILQNLTWVADLAILLNAFTILAIIRVVAYSEVFKARSYKSNASFHIFPYRTHHNNQLACVLNSIRIQRHHLGGCILIRRVPRRKETPL